MSYDLAPAASKFLDPADNASFRKVLGIYPTGVCAVTAAERDGQLVAMIVGSFTSVSLDPPLVAFFPAKRSTSWPRIRHTGTFCVNVLAADQESICKQISSTAPDRLTPIADARSQLGTPMVGNALAWLECQLEAVHDAGDHEIAVARVLSLRAGRVADPLIFFRGAYSSVRSTF